jgi:hypothetical protein
LPSSICFLLLGFLSVYLHSSRFDRAHGVQIGFEPSHFWIGIQESMAVETSEVEGIVPSSCVYSSIVIHDVRPTAIGTDREKRGRTDLQHRQALLRGRAVGRLEGSGEELMVRYL